MAAALCLVMAGCEDGQPSSQVQLDRGPYEDGVYLVYAPEYDADGWQEYGAITVSDGYIAQVEYDARNEVGEKKSQDTAYRDRMAAGNAMNGLPAVYPEKAYRDLIASFQQAQYDVEEVDTVAGATLSSERFRTVMAALLDFAVLPDFFSLRMSAALGGAAIRAGFVTILLFLMKSSGKILMYCF